MDEDEVTLRWAALERLPTYDKLRKSVLKSFLEEQNVKAVVHKEVDVRKLDISDKRDFIDRFIRVAQVDNEKFLIKFRNRIDRVGITLPSVVVKFKNLSVATECFIGERGLPTLLNTTRNIAESALRAMGIKLGHKKNLTILKDVSGIIKPSRMTLLLGPPSSGKTTLLLALAGKLDPHLKTTGEVTYNGHTLNEFVPQKSAAYISQNDVHVGEMTVRETFDFSARCQGVGSRLEILAELARMEKEAGILPDVDVDLFMKATAVQGLESTIVTDYILRILGLDMCGDTLVGNEMMRGISGGQMKRVTTGEMIVGPTKTLFMDEISTGLDSSTTFQIVKCLQQIVHYTDATIFMSLLQPAPEVFELFDDVILLSEGRIVYQGPCVQAVEFFESCGFKCPERKGVADFLQEVTSRKDQEQYWVDRKHPYRYITVSEFANIFKGFHASHLLEIELSNIFDKSKNQKAALVYKKYSTPRVELMKANFQKEWLLIKRNSFIHVFKTIQTFIVASITATMFLRTEMHSGTAEDGVLFIGALLFTMISNAFNGTAELPFTIIRLPVFYKHRDFLFHPAWTFTLPTFLLKAPISMLESIVWTITTYYTIGFSPEPSRFFKHLMLIFWTQQMAGGLFRLIAASCRTMIIANTGGSLALILMVISGGFILPREQFPDWWRWLYDVSPFSYCYNALAVNEMFAPRWMNKLALDGRTRLGEAILIYFDIYPEERLYWIGIVALVGFTLLFNFLFTFALMYLNPLDKPQTSISIEQARDMEYDDKTMNDVPMLQQVKSNKEDSDLTFISGSNTSETAMQHTSICASSSAGNSTPKRRMVLPFTPLTMSFEGVSYFVDMPQEMKGQGVNADKLQLLSEVTGAFRPGVLTALMGVSGAGKTTLMDVLAGRKTGGYIGGDIRISGFPKKQETFARISGYCEQTDIHSPQVTVRESLIYSSMLRLPKEVTMEEKNAFVDEVMDLVELGNLKDSIVGIAGLNGLSTGQRKRLTIAVELVANPSIIFMDEPTTGLDARAAAIVMRTVRNMVDTGRTVVCTIHQPSIDIFESFDELIFLKKGGHVIYAGPLGRHSQDVVEYFQVIPGVPKIKEKYNPATWMLEVSSTDIEDHICVDFAEYYKLTPLYEKNVALVRELSSPIPGTHDIHFLTQYSQTMWGQFKACLWKQCLTYWRSPEYNLVRYLFTLSSAILVGTIFWRIGSRRDSDTNLITVLRALYISVIFIGLNNCSTIQPVITTERTVVYRERASGMYSSLPYAMSQVIVEIPYVLFQAIYYTLIVYSMLQFEWVAAKFFKFFLVTFLTFLYFTYYGMMTVAITPNPQIATVVAGFFFMLFTLLSGFFIPKPRIPKWWIWYYWICPVSWTMHGLIIGQYGDVEEQISIVGSQVRPTIRNYIQNHLGYDPNYNAQVTVILICFSVMFASIYAISIKTLNFQVR